MSVDYKIEADQNLTLALEHTAGYGHLSTADLIALAQVNATLYAAEQQRIANLIALEAFKVQQYGSWGGPSLIFGNPATEFGNVPILDEIREGLGI